VKFPADTLIDDFSKSSFVGSMNVLIVFLGLKCTGPPFLGYLLEAPFDFREFMGGEDATMVVGACKCNAAVNILTPEARVICQRIIILDKERILAA
jgi:hypothetical protein